MGTKDKLSSLERRVLPVTALYCVLPYATLRFYVSRVMHSSSELAIAPSPEFLSILLVFGGLLPASLLGLLLRRLLAERERFRLGMLLEVYFSLVLLFATSYAVLQAGQVEPAFSAMHPVWVEGERVMQEVHVERLHSAFLDGLYLSIVTMTTVGYGDLAPLSPVAKALTALQGLAGIGFVGLALGKYFAVCLDCRGESE